MFAKVHAVAKQVSEIVVGKDMQIHQALVCLLAGGHLLIEDVPGVGKTTLAHALAISLGLQFNRLQFTSDLLPADVVGISIFDREKMPSSSIPVLSSRRCCWPMKSIAPRQKRNLPCWKRWKNAR